MVFICVIFDVILIVVGVVGFGVLVDVVLLVVDIVRWGGVVFLVVYGVLNFVFVIRGGSFLVLEGVNVLKLSKVIGMCFVLIWLNFYVYLDMVVLLGGILVIYDKLWVFVIGVVCVSFIFFFLLGYGVILLCGFFINLLFWCILDVFVGVMMWVIVVSLLLNY